MTSAMWMSMPFWLFMTYGMKIGDVNSVLICLLFASIITLCCLDDDGLAKEVRE